MLCAVRAIWALRGYADTQPRDSVPRAVREKGRELQGALELAERTAVGDWLLETDSKEETSMTHPVVSHEEWLAARRTLLEREKQLTRQTDDLNRQVRELPWELVTKEYVFEGAGGKETLADLFDGRSQLVIYHFMFHPDDKAGCPHCSLRADGFGGIGIHLQQRDVTMVVVSRAPHSKLAEYQKRMGWTFKWVSSGGTDFNFDFQA